ncbi:hypothetical protein GCM10010252_08830 [Streptomyces aureoverticillatus]|nr:hypothetical protein GCM10010252_08830 [Streptomyces aureoverticillatus]
MGPSFQTGDAPDTRVSGTGGSAAAPGAGRREDPPADPILFDGAPRTTYTHSSLALTGSTFPTHSVHTVGCCRLGEIKGS